MKKFLLSMVAMMFAVINISAKVNFTSSPSDGSTVESIKKVVVAFPDVAVAGYTGMGIYADAIKNAAGESLGAASLSFADADNAITWEYGSKAITADGTYTITIPAGLIELGDGENMTPTTEDIVITLKIGAGQVETAKVEFSLPYRKNTADVVKSVTHSGNQTITGWPTGMFEANVGEMMTIDLDVQNYQVDSVLVNNVKQMIDRGTVTFPITEYTSVEIFALPAAPAPLADGDYLIYNIETKQYLGGGHWWGTRASVGKPQWFTVALQDGAYTLDSHQSNGGDSHYLGSGDYVDAAAFGWTITKADDGTYTISGTIDGAVKYLSAAEVNGTVDKVDEAGANAKWQFINKAEFEATLANAKGAVDATALIRDPELKRNGNTDGFWTITSFDGTAKPKNFAQGQNGNIASCAESWHSGNGFKATQTITLPYDGSYALTAQGFYRQDNGEENIPYLFAGTKKSKFPARTGTENNMVDAYASFLAGTYPIDAVVFSGKAGQQIEIGYAGDAVSTWNIFGEMGLTYYPTIQEYAYVTVDNYKKVKLIDETGTELTVFDGKQKFKEGNYVLTAANDGYVLSSVLLNGEPVEAVNGCYALTLAPWDEVKVTADYTAETSKVEFSLPYRKNTGDVVKTVAHSGDQTITGWPTGMFEATNGYNMTFTLDEESYVVDSVLINNVKATGVDGVYTTFIDQYTSVEIFAKEFATVIVDNPANVKIQNENRQDIVTVAGAQKFDVGNYMITPALAGYTLNNVTLNGKTIKTASKGATYYMVSLAQGDVLEVNSDYSYPTSKVLFELPYRKNTAEVVKSVTHSGATEPQFTEWPTGMFEATNGYKMVIALDEVNFTVDSVLVNGTKVTGSNGVYTALVQDFTDVEIFALKTAIINVDDATKVKITNENRESLTVVNGEQHVAAGNYIISPVANYLLNSVTVNGEVQKPVYGTSYMLTLQPEDVVNITANYEPATSKVILQLPYRQNIKGILKSITHSGATEPQITEWPDPMFDAANGYNMTIVLDNENYIIDSVYVNGVKTAVNNGVVTTRVMKYTDVEICAVPVADINASINIDVAAAATVHKGGSASGKTIDLVDGDNAITVKSNNNTIVIVPADRKSLHVTRGNELIVADETTGYYNITLAEGDQVVITSEDVTPVFATATTSYLGSYYEGTVVEAPLNDILASIGATSMDEVTIYSEEPNGTRTNSVRGNTDGWRAADGTFAAWGSETCQFYVQDSEALPGAEYIVGGFPGKTDEAASYTAKLVYVNNTTGVESILNVTLNYVAAPKVELTVVDNIELAVEYECTADSYNYDPATDTWNENIISLTSDQITNICTKLGISELAEGDVYGYNPTTQEWLTSYAAYDGWRDLNGDFAGWTGDPTTVPCCVKVYDDGANYYCYNLNGATPMTVACYWAIANARNEAVLVKVNFTYVNSSANTTGIEGIVADANTTIYNVAGQKLAKTQRGINIINGKKIVKK